MSKQLVHAVIMMALIPYGYVDDRDVMWSKVVWEFVDLNQKINLPYYFP